MRRNALVGLGALIATSSTFLLAQPAPPPASEASAEFPASDARAVIERLATELEDNFVFPDKGKAYAEALRVKLAAGGYDKFPNGEKFAEAVTADLQAIHPDRHLRLSAPRTSLAGSNGRGGQASPLPESIERSGWIADGIAYISFNVFPGDPATLSKLQAFLTSHKDAKALIIDARTHRGGGLSEMDAMFPYFFEKPQALVHMDTRVAVERRNGGPLQEGETLTKVTSPEGVVRRVHKAIPGAATGLRKATIYLLTSERTASAAEHLSLSLKRTGRATLIGETTGGAGHYGGSVPLPGGFSAFIPVGRTFDPDTGEGWEGTGVKPDIAVPAEQALVEALVRTGVDRAEAEKLSAQFQPTGSMKRRRPSA